ncbi:MAG: glycoside hydrolase family 32 protein [Prolixibacteraceae bacterium]|jgi:fructan beta-fructosidase|nr:glycoside hydrolase family 32 protein [Prolixibacteraceae bacterium]MBT6004849.1 glycoside hydrolase family 32 protein [Prolixibacteraceae bacterium]MBT6763713.1 glycoside hydrolase family 32 protein [Prolixibacteraceae bacterium]MBT7000031.1 glycoside hydrolase family 32 protein [Prolixibacteraceae bacterium]MBT7394820.1 glycoside hydrolase family 32 protein [Prolixibacteraceae bacterium]
MKILPRIAIALLMILLFTSSKPEKDYYTELYRPQFHFTPEKNWHNDPNGLVFYKGEYHMFYQYNPKGNKWGFMHWGHTISTDLVHWEHYPIALYPDENSEDTVHCTAFSGSAIVDENNLLGKNVGNEKTLVAFYTSQHCGQRIAYSTDKGRTWEKYEGNPIIAFDKNDDARDPKVIWHEPTQKWIMALYRKTGEEENSKGVSFYTSDDLVNWEWKSHTFGFYECPDLIQLQVTNRPDEFKWILFDGDGSYLIGDFDGEKFTSESAKLKSDNGKNYYAAQTWSNIPEDDGRTIQIAWMKGGEFPEMPFNGQMTFPSELSLTKFNFGYKLVRKPVIEIESLHGKHYDWDDKNIIPGINENILKKVKGDCFHIVGEFDLKTSDNFGLMIRNSKKNPGTEVLYNVKRGTLSVLGTTVPLMPVDNKIILEILVDRASIEIYANGGQTVISNCFTPKEGANELLLFSNGGELEVVKLDIFEIKSAWSQK